MTAPLQPAAERLVLVLNCGSSSVKYELVEPTSGRRHAGGSVERIGEAAARHVHTVGDAGGDEESVHTGSIADHSVALARILETFEARGPALVSTTLSAVGHRVVMGGDRFAAPTVVDAEVEAAIEALIPLAPLHNPANLAGIRVARAALPATPHVAVFDTAYFQALPAEAVTYAIDREVAAVAGVRRYGFHGTSHRYVAGRVRDLLGRHDLRQIVFHLGNGASAAAIVGDRPVATTMGLTPLEGLVMGSRPGDLDPGVVLHLQRAGGWSIDEVDDLLNRRSGLLGLTGHGDLRDVHAAAAAGDADARLGLDVYVRRIKHYVGAFAAVMGGLDALTFTAGVGEHDAAVRARVIDGLDFLGLSIDPDRNAAGATERVISRDGSPATVLVVHTDEELAIARAAAQVASGPNAGSRW